MSTKARAKTKAIGRVRTGIADLDALLNGGFPASSEVVIMGPPGSGKTILAQQICFENATAKRPALYFSTLSEPTAKTLRFLRQFDFFDPEVVGTAVRFLDLGSLLRTEGLAHVGDLIMSQVKALKPSIVVVDSFRVFDDMARSNEELRKFSYEMAVNLMAWEATTFLLGEYADAESQTNPLFSVVDGIVGLWQEEEYGEPQRFLRVSKMRGTAHSRDVHTFAITPQGIEMFAPRVAIPRDPAAASPGERCETGIEKLDVLLGPGIPWGSSLLLSGVAGCGKTVLSLEVLYRGALRGEKGILFSFEETEERLRATARALGWDLESQIEAGLVEIHFIPQPEIAIHRHTQYMRERVQALGAKRVVIDSVSVFLHKIRDAQVSRDQLFHLCSIVHNAGAIALFTTDIPYGVNQLSRFGVEETVVDGVILLSSTEEGLERHRYIEVYKLRNTNHLKGRHNLTIDHDGVNIFPRYDQSDDALAPPLDLEARLSTGVAGLDALVGGGLLARSATIVSGSAGIGKTTLGVQFVLEGARVGERALYVSLEEGPAQILASAKALGLPLEEAVDQGMVEIHYLARANIRAGQFLTILTDRLDAIGATRLVLDAATHLVLGESTPPDELRELLYRLVVRFKSRGVTSLVTLEATSLHHAETATERALSPMADNLLVLRYGVRDDRLEPRITVVKTRGSDHDRGTYPFTIERGGIRVGERDARPEGG